MKVGLEQDMKLNKNELIKKISGEGNLIMLGDWNLIVGEGAERNTFGGYWL
jgi:hypothetical protein